VRTGGPVSVPQNNPSSCRSNGIVWNSPSQRVLTAAARVSVVGVTHTSTCVVLGTKHAIKAHNHTAAVI
jgi:hypothetical protein